MAHFCEGQHLRTVINRLLGTLKELERSLANDALFLVSEIGWPETIARFLDLGASMEARDQSGKTPLMLAAWENQAAGVEMLLSRGADVNARDYHGKTALMLANEHPRIVRRLIHGAADVHIADQDDQTATMGASAHSARLLLNSGANANVENRWGQTPLTLAIDRDATDAAEVLLSRGADPNRPNQFGETPFMRAIRNSQWQGARLCWEYGGRVDNALVDRNVHDQDGSPRLLRLRLFVHSLTHRRRRT